MNKPLLLRIAIIVVPLVSMLVSGVVVGLQVLKLQAATARSLTIRRDLGQVDRALEAIRLRPAAVRVAAVKSTALEQPQFLDILRAYAALSRVKLTRWVAVPPPQPGEEKDKAALPLPDGVIALPSTVEVEGDYGQVREFLYRLMYAPRLYTMTEPIWRREETRGGTRVTLTITRYLTP